MKSIGKVMMYESLEEIVDPGHTALVVWDVHRDFVDTSFNKAEFTQNLTSFLKAARDSNVPVIYTKINPLPKDFMSPWRMYMLIQREGISDPAILQSYMKPGSAKAEIPVELSPHEGDLIINKNTLSIFIGTNFEYLMRNRGIETLLFAGLRTEIGIDSCARDATARDFYTIVVEDCVSTIERELHEASLRTLKRVCLVLPSKDIIRAWK